MDCNHVMVLTFLQLPVNPPVSSLSDPEMLGLTVLTS